ncbi:hypothetical protein QTP88_005425 [Uroleucon formosanum]
MRNKRARRTEEQIQQQDTDARVHRAFISDSFLRLAFQYEPDIEYYAHSKVVIGAMDKECLHCHTLKIKNEPAGMCCASGKVQLPKIETFTYRQGSRFYRVPEVNPNIHFMFSNDII